MKVDEEDIELIEAYMRGDLDEQALASFQKRRQDDPEFDQQVTDCTRIIKQIQSSNEKEFMHKLRGWDTEIDSRPKLKILTVRTIFSIAASVLIIALAGVYMFRNNEATREQLFQEYFQPYENVIAERSGENDSQQAAMELYDQQKYDEAIIELNLASGKDPDNTALKCYLGIAYLAVNDTQKSKAIFEALALGGPSLFKEVAEWNLAMTYLKLDDEKPLNRTLEGIIQQKNHLFREQASELQGRLTSPPH